MLSHNNSGGPHISFATGVISLLEIYICIVNQCKYCNFCYGKIKLLNLEILKIKELENYSSDNGNQNCVLFIVCKFYQKRLTYHVPLMIRNNC